MNYEELVNDSILFFEDAQKRNQEKLEQVERESTKLQLKKELDAFIKLKGYWAQEKLRLELNKIYTTK